MISMLRNLSCDIPILKTFLLVQDFSTHACVHHLLMFMLDLVVPKSNPSNYYFRLHKWLAFFFNMAYMFIADGK